MQHVNRRRRLDLQNTLLVQEPSCSIMDSHGDSNKASSAWSFSISLSIFFIPSSPFHIPFHSGSQLAILPGFFFFDRGLNFLSRLIRIPSPSSASAYTGQPSLLHVSLPTCVFYPKHRTNLTPSAETSPNSSPAMVSSENSSSCTQGATLLPQA